MSIFLIETRSLQIAQSKEVYLSCDYVYFASTIERAEFWMQGNDPEDSDRFYYAIVEVTPDRDIAFQLIGYYNMLGEKTTKDRCVEMLFTKK